MKPNNRPFEQLSLGDEASFSRTISKEDVAQFSALSGDYNSLHVDAEYAAGTPFGKPVVHGMLVASLLSQLVGMHLPGLRALYLQQTLLFKNPVFIGDVLTVKGSVLSLSSATQTVELSTHVYVAEVCVLEGTARVRII